MEYYGKKSPKTRRILHYQNVGQIKNESGKSPIIKWNIVKKQQKTLLDLEKVKTTADDVWKKKYAYRNTVNIPNY